MYGALLGAAAGAAGGGTGGGTSTSTDSGATSGAHSNFVNTISQGNITFGAGKADLKMMALVGIAALGLVVVALRRK